MLFSDSELKCKIYIMFIYYLEVLHYTSLTLLKIKLLNFERSSLYSWLAWQEEAELNLFTTANGLRTALLIFAIVGSNKEYSSGHNSTTVQRV